MRKVSQIKISKFNSLTAKTYSTIFMFEELRHIKYGTYKTEVLNCRRALAEGDKNLYVKLKSNLPSVTFCGEFKGRKASDIIEYNNLMILDIDDLPIENLESIKNILIKDNFILSLWKSPSGKGLKCLIRVNSNIENHKATFNSIALYFFNNYNIVLDKSGKDISRLCFSSWDENIYYNPNSAIYTDKIEDDLNRIKKVANKSERNISLLTSAYATEGLNKKDDRSLMKKIIQYLTKKDISITDSYDSWTKVALGISYTFSYDVGEKYFIALCRLDKEMHDEEKSLRLLKSCYNSRKISSSNTITFSTIIFFAKEKGYILKRNNS